MLYTLLFLLLTFLILTHSEVSLYYAFHGFSLWYSKMIPALVPFMIISGILIRMNLSEGFAKILHPLLKKLYKCSENVSYAIIIGFLCGFPMGAKVTADLLTSHKISREEGEFLLAFNNNIGPVYFCSFALPLLGIGDTGFCLFGMYGIPLVYAFLLRRTVFRNMSEKGFSQETEKNQKASTLSLFDAIDESIKASVQSILMLCGYMILFNALNILPHYLLPAIHKYIAPILEITGGLSMLQGSMPLYSLCLLQFGGLSCIAQTNSMIRGTGMSVTKYIWHKMLLTGLVFLYYLLLIFIDGFRFSGIL